MHKTFTEREEKGDASPSEKEYLNLIVLQLLFLQALSMFDQAIAVREDLAAERLLLGVR